MRDEWRHWNPVEVLTGAGKLESLPEVIASEAVLLVTTPGFEKRGLAAEVKDLLGQRLQATHTGVEPNPSLEGLADLREHFSGQGIEAVLALGGGSAIDTGKALSVLLAPAAESFELAEHLRQGTEFPALEPLPLTAVPTTHGTGSEVTPFATIWSREEQKKYSLADESIYPHRALLDPRLTLTLPEKISVATGLDALSQGLEALWNRNATPLSDLFAAEAVRLAFDNLKEVVRDPEDLNARSKLQRAALCSGIAISQTRTALSHSMSYPLTARFGLPHGLACGITLPAIWDFVAEVEPERAREIVGKVGFFKPADLQEGLETLFEVLGVDELLRENVEEIEDLLEPRDEMYTPGRADNSLGNPAAAEIESILTETVELFEEG